MIVIYDKHNLLHQILVSIVVSIPACHAGDRGSIPRRGGTTFAPIHIEIQTFRRSKYVSNMFLILFSSDKSVSTSVPEARVESDGRLLRIASVELRHAGNYSCLARNHFGVDEITYALVVKCK